jgi:hypothetical protein
MERQSKAEAHISTHNAAERSGPLTRRVLEYDQAMKRVVAEAGGARDWAPVAELVAVDDFERVGTFLEVQNWSQYTEMLNRWASATESFETTARRISEFGSLVYYEIEERHVRGDNVNIVNSMTVFEFDVHEKIRRLNVYLQQAP